MFCPIQDVRIIPLKTFADERGSFCESFRMEWIPETWLPETSQRVLQANLSRSIAGVLRGLHFHNHQFDWWVCVSGKLRVGLHDLRKSSPTRGVSFAMDLLPSSHGVYIPPGVAHGFYAVEDSCLNYLVNQVYNPRDELGVRYDSVSVDWQLRGPVILSERDQKNPALSDIQEKELPE